jgi:hypothetical protein
LFWVRGVALGLAVVAIGGTLFVWNVGSELAHIDRRLDAHDRALAAIADLILLPEPPPAP